jgi:hypothetical protein
MQHVDSFQLLLDVALLQRLLAISTQTIFVMYLVVLLIAE